MSLTNNSTLVIVSVAATVALVLVSFGFVKGEDIMSGGKGKGTKTKGRTKSRREVKGHSKKNR